MKKLIYIELLLTLFVVSFFSGALYMDKIKEDVEPVVITVHEYWPPPQDDSIVMADQVGGLLFRREEYDTILCKNEGSCLHEVGHIVYLENIDAAQWERDITNYLNEDTCEKPPFSGFPGICENPMASYGDNPWGGIVELYSNMYADYNKFVPGHPIPDELSHYFQEQK